MTVKTRANFQSSATTNINDNTTGDVSPADVRQQLLDLSDSATFPEDLTTNVAFTGATSVADGTSGLVPKPLAGQQNLVVRGDGALGSPITEGSVQPTADIGPSASLAVTGLSAYKRVDIRWFFEIKNQVNPDAIVISITARVSGGTKRTLMTTTSGSVAGNSKNLFYGDLSISGFNEAQEKIIKGSYGFGTVTTLDSSNAINTADTSNGDTRALLTWDEVWDEISIDIPGGGAHSYTLIGTATDERGRLYWYGYP